MNLHIGTDRFAVTKDTSDLDNIITFTDFSEYTFLEINGIKYFIGAPESFIEKFVIITNKRGGDNSKILFSRSVYNFLPNNIVKLIIEGIPIYLGYIEFIDENDKQLNIVPQWNRLRNMYVTNELVVDGLYKVKDIVEYLVPLIEKIGINIGNVSIEDSYEINYKIYGKSYEQILKDMEEFLPSSFVWGVNEFNKFYFYELVQDADPYRVSYDLNDFEKTDYSVDYSSIFSQSLVKTRGLDLNGNEFQKIIGVVGIGNIEYNGVQYEYPELSWRKFVGDKQNIFELEFSVDPKYAFDTAYKFLQLQTLPEKIKMSNINFKRFIPFYNRYYKIIQDPQNGLNISISKNNEEYGSTIFKNNSFIQLYNRPINKKPEVIQNEFLIYNNKKYLNVCDVSTNIEYITIFYFDRNPDTKFIVSDSVNSFEFLGKNGIARINVTDYYFNKYELKIEALNNPDGFLFISADVNFKLGSKVTTLVSRKVSYSYASSIFTASMELSNLNTKLTGAMFDEKKRIDKIESILSANKGV